MKNALHHGKTEQARPRRRRAIVLILVMIVIVMISLSGFSFVATMSNENKAVHVRGEQLQMEYVLDSAEEFLKQLLARPKPSLTTPETSSVRVTNATSIDDESLMRGVVVINDTVPNGRVRFTVLAPRYDESETSKWNYGLARESSRLDLRSVMDWETQKPGSGRMALMQLPGVTESIADALLDWMDADHVARQSGAEDDFYATLNPPYAPRNAIPESLEELLLVKGVSRSMLFGGDIDQNHRLEFSERELTRTTNERATPDEVNWPWAELLTLYSGERNLTVDGKPRINVNDPDLVQLHWKIKAAFDLKLATFVVLYRQFGPMIGTENPSPPNVPKSDNRQTANSANLALVKNPTSTNGATIDLATTPPNFAIPAKFLFRSPIDLVQSQVQVPPAAGKTGIVASPVSSERERSNQSLADLCDRLTTTNEPVIRGRINVNLAVAPVLRTIPGMDAALADQIVAARTTPGGPNRNHEGDPIWLYTDGLLDVTRLKDLYPYLTTGGDVYRAQIVAFSEASRLSQRVEIVLDASRLPVRRLIRKDLQVLGRGYPWDVLDTPAGIAYTRFGASDATPVGN